MRIGFVGLSAFFIASSAAAMPVSTFLQKAQALKASGPLALLSSDYRLLKNELSSTMEALHSERLAAVRAGRPPAYCPTQQSGSMSVGEIMGAMNAVPPAARPRPAAPAAPRAPPARRPPRKG